MIIKPTRPWKNLEAARRSFNLSLRDNPGKYPCLACGGRGGYYDENDRDPYEGYKMASLHKCRSCNGTRLGSKAAFVEYYNEDIAKYKKELTEYKHKLKRFRELKKQLSKEDLEILWEGLR